MTFDQGLVFAVVIAMMGLFAWGRWRLRPRRRARPACLCGGRHRAAQSSLQRLQRRHRDHRRERSGRQCGGRALRHHRARGPLARTLSYDHRPADRCSRRLGHTALGLRQEHRRARNADADRLSARAAHRHLALLSVDADVVRRSARRHRHLGRHIAEHHRLARARAVARPALQYVRLHAGRRRDRDCRLPLSRVRLASSAAESQGSGLHGCGLQSRRLHHGSHRARDLARRRLDSEGVRGSR